MALIQCSWVSPTGWRCDEETMEHSMEWCIVHLPAAEMDLSAYHSARVRAARYKLASALPIAADLLLDTVKDAEESTANRLKAAVEVFDRTGIPRAAASTVTLQGELSHRVTMSAADTLNARLDALAVRAYPELAGTVDGSVDLLEDPDLEFAPPAPPDRVA